MIRLLKNWNGYEAGTQLNPENPEQLIKQGIAVAVEEAAAAEQEEAHEVRTKKTVERPGKGRSDRRGKTGR